MRREGKYSTSLLLQTNNSLLAQENHVQVLDTESIYRAYEEDDDNYRGPTKRSQINTFSKSNTEKWQYITLLTSFVIHTILHQNI